MGVEFAVYFEIGFEFHTEPNSQDLQEYTQDFRKKVIESFGEISPKYDFITTYHPNKNNPKDFKFRVYPKSTYIDKELEKEWNKLVKAEQKIRKKAGLRPLNKTLRTDVGENVQKRRGLQSYGLLKITVL
jgi:hypothetical protein